MKSLYSHIVAVTLSVMLVSGLIAFLLSNVYYQFYLKSYNDQKITHMAKDMKRFYDKNQDVNIDNYLKSVGDLGYQILLVDDSGNKKYIGGEFRKKTIDPDVIKSVLSGTVYHGIAQYPFGIFVTGFFENSLKNTVGVPLTVKKHHYALFLRQNTELQFGEMRIFLSVLLLLSILLSILLVVISTRYTVKPIKKLTEATKTISKGHFNVKLNVNRRDEIGQLATQFSKMAKSLEQLEMMRQEFVSNVSHEIQSPLASIKGFADTLKSNHLTQEERNQYLSIIKDESDRMSQLSKQLLLLASLDKEEDILEKESYDLAEQVKQVVVLTEYSWQVKDIAISLNLTPTMIYADKKLLHQVWTNLLTNSIKYTNEGGSISLSVKEDDKKTQVFIKDNGIGISEQDLTRIFERFYKADKARKREESSSGLGLAIVRRILDLHDATINVDSRLGVGTTVTITFLKL